MEVLGFATADGFNRAAENLAPVAPVENIPMPSKPVQREDSYLEGHSTDTSAFSYSMQNSVACIQEQPQQQSHGNYNQEEAPRHERQEEGTCQCVSQDDFNNRTFDTSTPGKPSSPKTKGSGVLSTAGSRPDLTSDAVSLRWLLDMSDAGQLSRGALSKISSARRTEDHISRFADAELIDDEAVLAIDVLREWGVKEKEELFLRRPRLEAYAASEPHTPLSAVLTGFPSSFQMAEKNTVNALELISPLPNKESRGTVCGNKVSTTMIRPLSMDDMKPCKHKKIMKQSADGPRVNNDNFPSRIAREDSQVLLTKLSPMKSCKALLQEVDQEEEEVSDEDVLSRGICCRNECPIENHETLLRRGKKNKVEKRAIRLNNAFSECHFIGENDILQTLRDEAGSAGCGGDGDDGGASKHSLWDCNKLSKSVMRLVAALAERSLKRGEGDDGWVELNSEAEELFPTEGGGEGKVNKTSESSKVPEGAYTSAEDEAFNVMDLLHMAAMCADLPDTLSPTTTTEVVT